MWNRESTRTHNIEINYIFLIVKPIITNTLWKGEVTNLASAEAVIKGEVTNLASAEAVIKGEVTNLASAEAVIVSYSVNIFSSYTINTQVTTSLNSMAYLPDRLANKIFKDRREVIIG